MTLIPASRARAHWAETVDAAKRAPVTVTEHGRETVTIMDARVARAALAALEKAPEAAAGAFVPVEDVAVVLRELGADAAWLRELNEARSEVEMTDPWETGR